MSNEISKEAINSAIDAMILQIGQLDKIRHLSPSISQDIDRIQGHMRELLRAIPTTPES